LDLASTIQVLILGLVSTFAKATVYFTKDVDV